MIDWKRVPNFHPDEFPEDPDRYADPKLIYTLQAYRTRINQAVYPSPVKGALARFGINTTSQHSAVDRKSRAVDVFAEGVPVSNFACLITVPEIMGIGIYLDTNGPDAAPWIMFHMDIRGVGFTADVPLVWICKKVQGRNKYYYPQKDPAHWSLLRQDNMYQERRFGK